MSDEYINYGKSGIFKNEDATEENKQPAYRGRIVVDTDIPKGTVLRIAGWENRQGGVVKNIGLSLSSKVGETADDTYKKQTQGSSYNVDKDENIPF
jgi:hypothetical protein